MEKIRRFKLSSSNTEFEGVKISSSIEAYNYIKQFYHDDIEIYESFYLLLLNRAKVTIGYAKISQGGTIGTVVDNKIIAKYCIDSMADSVILAHNHPSGNRKPSEQDIRLTKKIKEMLYLHEVDVADHLIITKNNYFSFSDEGVII